jgi:hypothetical protein
LAKWVVRVVQAPKGSPETRALKAPAWSVPPAQLALAVLPEHKVSPATRALRVRLRSALKVPRGLSEQPERKA